MKQLKLNNSTLIKVDDEDYQYLSRFTWRDLVDSNDNHHITTNWNTSKHSIAIPMWRFLVKAEIKRKIIFLDRDSLNYQKENLIAVRPSIWNLHSGPMNRVNKTSKYKGVCYYKKPMGGKHWKGTLQYLNKESVKWCITEKEAALWYNQQSFAIAGQLAYQNKIS